MLPMVRASQLQYQDASGYLEKIYENKAHEEDARTESEKKLYNAYKHLYDAINTEFTIVEDLRRFKGFVLKKILFVQIETKDMSDALKIFETINQRGVGLNPMDLLKNLIFMQVDRDKFKELNLKWSEITRTLEKIEDQPLRFLRYYIMANYDTSSFRDGIIREDQIYDWLKNNNEQCHYTDQPFRFVDQMIDGVRKYTAFLNPTDETEGNAHLKNISSVAGKKYKLHIQLLLAVKNLDQESMKRLKEVLESVVYYATITRTKTNNVERQFAQWCTKLRDIRDIEELNLFIESSIIPVVDTWKLQYKSIFMNLGIDTIQQYRVRFILGRIGR